MANKLPAATRDGIAERGTASSEHRDKGYPPSPPPPLLCLEGRASEAGVIGYELWHMVAMGRRCDWNWARH